MDSVPRFEVKLTRTDTRGVEMERTEQFAAWVNIQEGARRYVDAGDVRSTFAGFIGHDLRQFLHIINGSYERLRSKLDDPAQLIWLERGEHAAARLKEQLDSLVVA